ncbi:Extracellular serine protease precursor [Rubripirellula lacrimiformis]|uniref:Extracellular serine protease n=1 Tax=Rubripirellula lacrimiformis TaxID=1930273 RepID=A0A517NFA7_9BACT|nr:autotransporter outer membrane beta-barrel domain-containing protein [Rubripirellula lacrimiformis]QDT05738.1 Extracellular serine protease precursor [Rubripirellula lacrimiformis]
MKKRRARLALFLAILSGPVAMATDFDVSNFNDSGAGSLRAAIESLNAAGAGTHAINFASGLDPIDLSLNLPMIVGTDQTITISGAGNTVSGQNNARLFFIADGDVTIENMTLKQGFADGGDGGDGRSSGGGGAGAGGALFVNSGANVVISGVTLDGNMAAGGNGGRGDFASGGGGGGGGGGGFSGDGGSTYDDGGGGGGGFDGNGGYASSLAGAGGGGVSGDGGDTTYDAGGGGGGGIGDGESTFGPQGGKGAGGAVGGGDYTDGATGTPGGGGGGYNGGGGDGAVNGGGGGSGFDGSDAGNGGTFGGGGGAGSYTDGGDGGDFGGGGGGGDGGDGGAFGGGAGAGDGGSDSNGIGGFGGGDGGAEYSGAGGGDAMGGAIFVRQGGTLSIIDSTLIDNDLTAGTGGSGSVDGADGQTIGSGMYLHTGVNAGYEVTTGTTTLDDQIGGSGSLTKTGDGELILSSTNTYTGTTTVSAGRLAVNGSLAGNATVGTDGELGGSGTISGDVINNGTFAAGNSIGTLAIGGNASFHSGSTTEVEIQPSATPVAGTDNDLITADTAMINGGDVSVLGSVGSYTDGAKYTFLQASGGVTGVFESITDDLAFFDAELGYDLNSAFFTLVANSTDYASVGGSGNRGSVGFYIDENSIGATGDFGDVLDEFRMLTNAQVQSGLSQLSGEVYGSQSQVVIQGTNQLIGTIGGQLRSGMFSGSGSGASGSGSGGFASTARSTRPAAPASGSNISLVSYVDASQSQTSCDALIAPTCRAANQWRGWMMGYGLGGSADSDGNAAGINYGLGGTTFGIQRSLNDNTQLGFFGGYIGSSVSADNMDQTVRANGGNFGSYLTLSVGSHYGIAMGGLQFDGYDSDRTIQVGGLTRTASGKTDGWQGFAYGERGMNLNLSRSRVLQPFAGLQYVYARQNGFTETGAGAMNLAMSGVDTHSLRSNLGSRLQWQSWTSRRGWGITPEIRASWMHEFLDTTSVVNAQFAGVGGAGFSANGLDLGRDWAIVGGGFAARPGDRWELRADYDTQFNDRQVLHIGSGSVSYVW